MIVVRCRSELIFNQWLPYEVFTIPLELSLSLSFSCSVMSTYLRLDNLLSEWIFAAFNILSDWICGIYMNRHRMRCPSSVNVEHLAETVITTKIIMILEPLRLMELRMMIIAVAPSAPSAPSASLGSSWSFPSWESLRTKERKWQHHEDRPKPIRQALKDSWGLAWIPKTADGGKFPQALAYSV